MIVEKTANGSSEFALMFGRTWGSGRIGESYPFRPEVPCGFREMEASDLLSRTPEELKLLRRRIEDRLRKADDPLMLWGIAMLLGVKITE